jgi:hypothetical protein
MKETEFLHYHIYEWMRLKAWMRLAKNKIKKEDVKDRAATLCSHVGGCADRNEKWWSWWWCESYENSFSSDSVIFLLISSLLPPYIPVRIFASCLKHTISLPNSYWSHFLYAMLYCAAVLPLQAISRIKIFALF